MIDNSLDRKGILAFAVLGMIFIGMLSYSYSNRDTDVTRINNLSSFTVKNNPNAEKDYYRLVSYKPKTNYGDDFKTKKAIQKLDELNTLGKKMISFQNTSRPNT